MTKLRPDYPILSLHLAVWGADNSKSVIVKDETLSDGTELKYRYLSLKETLSILEKLSDNTKLVNCN